MPKRFHWNQIFTNLIRNTRPAYWGNWSLNPQVQPGAIGRIIENSGDFQFIAKPLEGSDVGDETVSSKWELSTESVKKHQAEVELKGGVTDPTTHEKVEAGLKASWEFGETGSISSQFTVTKESHLANPGDLVKANLKHLIDLARSNSMASGDHIAQGFGIITSVVWAKAGMNLGSYENNSKFSMTGSVKGIQGMLGDASVNGSYLSTEESKTIDKRIWPDAANKTADTIVPIAYTFASFDGQLFIPNWITHLHSFEIILDNKPGGTYITHNKLRYDTPTGAKEDHATVSGGLTKTFGNIPLNATNIQLDIAFDGVTSDDKYPKHWHAPLGNWLNGQRHIELSGVWPGKTHVKILEEE